MHAQIAVKQQRLRAENEANARSLLLDVDRQTLAQLHLHEPGQLARGQCKKAYDELSQVVCDDADHDRPDGGSPAHAQARAPKSASASRRATEPSTPEDPQASASGRSAPTRQPGGGA